MAVSMSSSWLLWTWVGLLMVMVRWASATNPDVEALSALRQSLSDPDHVLDSWDPNLVDACTWLHVTCDSDSRVTRVYAAPSSPSPPQLPSFVWLSSLLVKYLQGYKTAYI